VHAPFVKNLQTLGIDATMRMVDPAQFQRRMKDFDYDITPERYTMRNTPGVELRSYFSSDAAKTSGSLNLAGIADPAVDALIEKAIGAKSREELNNAASALDRVLRAGTYWVPHWYKGSNDIAYWDKFSRPETKPRFDRGVLDTWWYDDAKAAKLTQAAARSEGGETTEQEPRASRGIIFAVLAAFAIAGYILFRRRRTST
jgi:microcin C transport system substrate-binding protein